MTELVDIGINLTSRRFVGELDEIIKRAGQAGVTKLIITGTSFKGSLAAAALCDSWDDQEGVSLYFTVGIHPHDASNWRDDTYSKFKKLIMTHPRAVAVGECGLDYNRMFSPKEVQQKVFEEHLKLAVETGKPLFLHERDSFEDFQKILSKYMPKLKGAVVHCFTGDEKAIKTYVAMGCHIGFTGFITDSKRGNHLPSLVNHVPIDKLMVETDGPFLLPHNMPLNEIKACKRRCEPRHCIYVLKAVFDAWTNTEISYEDFAKQIHTNSCRFFNITSK